MVLRSASFASFGLLALLFGCTPPAATTLGGAPEEVDRDDTEKSDKPLVSAPERNPDTSAPPSAASNTVDAAAPSSLDGTTWTGTYDGQKRVGSCFANNAGSLTIGFTQKAGKLTSKNDMTGIDQRNTQICSTAGTTNGSSGDEDTQLAGLTIFGTWNVSASGPTSQFNYPFMAQMSGTTIHGNWRCDNCPGEFTVTKQ
jgi:hypothetical protein